MRPREPASVERRGTRMREMIRRLDVDVLELAYAGAGSVYAEAAKTCLTCENTSACLAWIDAQPRGAEHPTFCPNLRVFERFATQRD